MYPFPWWRRVIFVATLVAIIMIAFAPAVTQGTAIIRFSAFTVPSAVTHLYVSASAIQLHREGTSFSSNSSWTSVSQTFPTIDLISPPGQPPAQPLSSSTLHSGRYDAVRVAFTNCTLIVAGQNKQVSAPPTLSANVTLAIPPNSVGDVLIVVEFDYASVFANSPSLAFTLIRISAS